MFKEKYQKKRKHAVMQIMHIMWATAETAENRFLLFSETAEGRRETMLTG